MARGRMISKSLSTSERWASLYSAAGRRAEFCQALYVLMVAHSDDFGRLQGDAFTIKHAVAPTSPRKLPDFELALAALHHVGLIVWYEVEQRRYVEIVGFDAHQTGLHKRKENSAFPDVPGISRNCREIPGQLNGIKEKRTEQKRTRTSPNGDDVRVRFDQFWAVYPKKVAKRDAWAFWKSLTPSVELTATIVADVARRAVSREWTDEGGRFIPHPSKFLRKHHWEDESTTSANGSTVTAAASTPWTPILAAIRDKVTNHVYQTWFAPLRFVRENVETIVVQARDRGVADYILTHYHDPLHAALGERSIVFEIGPEAPNVH